MARYSDPTQLLIDVMDHSSAGNLPPAADRWARSRIALAEDILDTISEMEESGREATIRQVEVLQRIDKSAQGWLASV